MLTPKFSFELAEKNISKNDKWNLGYSGISSGLLVIIKNGEMRKNRVLDICDDNGKAVYDLDTNPLQVTGGVKKLITLWYQDIALGKGNRDDIELSKNDLVKVFESSEKA